MHQVRVPATTANLGPGFDALGLALNLYNTVTVSPSHAFSLTVKGEGKEKLPQDESSLLIEAAQAVFEKADYHPGALCWVQENFIPLQSGLGSSAATIVAGLKLANALLPAPLSTEEIHRLAVEIEKHPDNVTPAVFGGLTVSYHTEEGPCAVKAGIPPGLHLALAVPDFSLATVEARNALPESVSREDAVFNLGRASLLVTSLMNGNGELLRWACEDRLHQPYRARLIPGFQDVMEAALEAGAQGCALSGAGPTVAAFWIDKENHFAGIASAMKDAFQNAGVSCRVFPARPDGAGAVINHNCEL